MVGLTSLLGLRTVAEGWKGTALMKTLKRSNFLVGSFEGVHIPALGLAVFSQQGSFVFLQNFCLPLV